MLPGKTALDGDTVEMVRNDGSRETMKAVGGRRYLISAKPRLVFNNYEAWRQERASR